MDILGHKMTQVHPPPIAATGKTLLFTKGLCKAFGGYVVLDKLSLELHRGEVVLLRGNNGSGKTTLLNILTGNIEPDAGTIQFSTNGVEENFHFPKRWWRNLNPFNHFAPERVSHEGVGRTWQDVRLFSTQNLRDNIAVAAPNQKGENPILTLVHRSAIRAQERKIRSESEAILAELGLSGREVSSADKISLGQSKRVAIARAVKTGAHILFLDEPLSGLDSSGVSEIMGLLEKLAHDTNLTLVIVEHVLNIPFILNLATTVWTLEDGKITVESPVDVQTKIAHIDDGVEKLVREMAGSSNTSIDQKLPNGALLSAIIPAHTQDDVVLEVEDLVVYRGKRLVIGEQESDGNVRGVTFALRRGQLAILRAVNGWGKTTLLEAIVGIVPVSRGTIRLNSQMVQSLPPWKRAKLGISFLQSCNHTFPNLTVREMFRFANVHNPPHNLIHLLGRKMSDLSGGEKQKVALARLMNGKKFVVGLLDEPFSTLDTDSMNHVRADLLDRIQDTALLVAVPDVIRT